MESVALAGPPRVFDNLQTCPTVYKSGALIESTLPAFFCQTPDASLDHGPLTWYFDPAKHHFAIRNGFRELFSNKQCLVCISDSFWESVSICHGHCKSWYHMQMISHNIIWNKEIGKAAFWSQTCRGSASEITCQPEFISCQKKIRMKALKG